MAHIAKLFAAPPHPRGWTQIRQVAHGAELGSPAPAGMDPRDNRDRNSSFWLPRTRGDGPLLGASSLRPSTAPPHPRGWTPILSCVSYRYRGSPAPAGMDLDDRCAACVAEWLPRTRGDGPDQQGASRHQDGAPPHPRGWTRGRAGKAGSGRGSPAPAGMDPTLVCRAITPVRLPRTRGDGPCVHNEIVETMGGSPAPAGMDPTRSARCWLGSRLPRTRGDGPAGGPAHEPAVAAPPHPRGWTLRGEQRQEVPHGSPAPAGMDPMSTTSWTRPERLSRTRGDGPEPLDAAAIASQAPPHPRGWTRSQSVTTSPLPGSPAPAGMDPPIA